MIIEVTAMRRHSDGRPSISIEIDGSGPDTVFVLCNLSAAEGFARDLLSAIVEARAMTAQDTAQAVGETARRLLNEAATVLPVDASQAQLDL